MAATVTEQNSSWLKCTCTLIYNLLYIFCAVIYGFCTFILGQVPLGVDQQSLIVLEHTNLMTMC